MYKPAIERETERETERARERGQQDPVAVKLAMSFVEFVTGSGGLK